MANTIPVKKGSYMATDRLSIFPAQEETFVIFHEQNLMQGMTVRKLAIDLNDTINYPHTLSNFLEISNVTLNYTTSDDKFRFLFKIGLVTRTGVVNGDVYWFSILDSTEKGKKRAEYNIDLIRDNIRLNVKNSIPEFFITSSKLLNQSWLSSTSTLLDVSGTSKSPEVGDVIWEYQHISDNGVLNVVLHLGYIGR